MLAKPVNCESNELCDQCKTNKKCRVFYLQKSSYFRTSGDYFFCSIKCQNKFKHTKMCQICFHGDSNDLAVYSGDGKMYCTDYPGEIISCYKRIVGKYLCSFCNTERSTYTDPCYILNDCNDDEHVFACSLCIDPLDFITHPKYGLERGDYHDNNGWRTLGPTH